VLAVGEVALDDLLEARLEQEALGHAVEGRREARDGGGGEQAPGTQRAPRLLQGARSGQRRW
jgi:type II secretory pathway component PulK